MHENIKEEVDKDEKPNICELYNFKIFFARYLFLEIILDLLSLFNLKSSYLIASGGKNLKFIKIDFTINYLILQKNFENNERINKIILLEKKI